MTKPDFNKDRIKCGEGILSYINNLPKNPPKLTLKSFKEFCDKIDSEQREERERWAARKKQNLKEFKASSFGKIYNKLTISEQNEHSILMLRGQVDFRNGIVLMGGDAIDKVRDFENKMIEKYD